MNHKQKLGYTLLGAGIMAVGITIGQFVTPNIEAQNNGVFDKIVCREIEVVDQDGNQAISLGSNERGNGVIVYDNQGKTAFVLHSSEKRDNTLFIFDKQGKAAISLASTEGANLLGVMDNQGNQAVTLHSRVVGGNAVIVIDKQGKAAAALSSNEKENLVIAVGKRTGKEMILGD